MVRPHVIALLLAAAGCAGAEELSRPNSEGALGDAQTSTSGSEAPLTTGLTTITTGAPDAGADTDADTGSDAPSSDTDGRMDDGDTGSSGEPADGSSSTGNVETGSEETGTASADAVDLSGWVVVQQHSSRSFTVPEGTLVPAGTVIVIGRDATRGEFEGFWGSLGETVVYFDAADGFPTINGEETYTLLDDSDAVIDGPTPPMESGDIVRRDGVETSDGWSIGGEADADPGIGHPESGAPGVFLTEVGDASGSGNFRFEYVELQAWP